MRNLILTLLIFSLIGCNSEINKEEVKESAFQFVNSFAETWAVEENHNKLNDFFTENFYTISPSDSFRLEGRVKNVNGYKKFLESTDILDYSFNGEDIQIYNSGKCAIVSLYYYMNMKVGKDTLMTSGRDMLILVKENNNWKIAADHFSNFPK